MQHRLVKEHVLGLRTAVEEFVASAQVSDLEARVPTCPAWTVRALLAHQGMVHRWARANLLRQESHPPSWNAEGRQVEDPLRWLVAGADELVAAIEAVPDDVRARVFLHDAPEPRVFWARRQCHETTIHAVDALAARLSAFPAPEDAGWIDEATALDGIDELLTGFVTRGTSRFAGVGERAFSVRPEGTTRWWSVQIASDGAVRTTRGDDADEAVRRTRRDDADGAERRTREDGADGGARTTRGDDADAHGHGVDRGEALTGSARALYLTLWNRADPGSVVDPGGVLALWAPRARVRWS